MKKSKKINAPPVSVIIPMRNSSTTVLETLKSIVRQNYPIREIIIVDNVSKDNSREIVRVFAKKSPIRMRLLLQKKDKGVSSSYNWGLREAKTQLVVFLTSDCTLPTQDELEKLVKPLIKDPLAVASYSTCTLPRFVWDTYNFWEKFFSARMVDNISSGMVLKFDCVKKLSFLSIGGFDEINFGGDSAIGGEDADLSTRLRKIGKIVRSKAHSFHLHYKGLDYNLFNMARSRKMYARSQGRFLRKWGLSIKDACFAFLPRPLIAISGIFIVGLPMLVLYSFLYTPRMFTTRETLLNPRIITIPFLNIAFLYYELYWLIRAFLSYKKKAII
ncbi:MAG: glycosyltransferase family 2 protein [Candidatus Levyibacteriota bacterium]